MTRKGFRQNLTFFLLIVTLPFYFPCHAKEGSEKAVERAYKAWCTALAKAAGDGKIMTAFYADNAILLPTLSPDILINHPNGGVEKYFSTLTALPDIKCTPGRFIFHQYGEIVVTAGTYTFSYRETDQKMKVLPARFTFVYQKSGERWMIVNQHSSLLPAK